MKKDFLDKVKAAHKTIKDQINDLNNQMKEISKVLMHSAFEDFFEKYSDVVDNVFWTQYTPHFNDGEECTFGVNDIYLLLIGDEDACEYEGSELYTEKHIVKIRAAIHDLNEWAANPEEYTRRYRSDYIKKWDRDPFAEKTWQSRSTEQRMKDFRPHHGAISDYEKELEIALEVSSKYPNLADDFYDLKNLIRGIEESVMKSAFGDHAKVVVTQKGIEIEEYNHD